jgi:phage terminase small subunit
MNLRQKRFVQEYIRDLNATQAAFRAGYSKDTCYSIGYRLLRDVEISAAIAASRDEMAEKAGFAAVDVLKRWVAIATADPNELVRYEYDENGVGRTIIADTRTLSPQARMLYAGVKQTKDGIEVKMHDQLKALEMAARHLGMFVERVEFADKTSPEQIALRQAMLRELMDMSKPAPLTIEGAAAPVADQPGVPKPPKEWE